ncbi:MAG: WbqC family protein [Prolixibacteraceae bacterium]|nr:WbqC family protein [Prolixibacteraceae bacterium]MBN2772874.1 WbqC family protein [Prolixibacteraceae bacterium]
MTKNPVLLSTSYLPPIEYFSAINTSSEFYIEKHENFIKQSYRNRCMILGANEPIGIVIPVEKGRGGKKPIQDIKIYNHLPWQRNHWRTIFSAYNSSPFFEYYKDDFIPYFEKKWNFLFDLNNALLETILEILELPSEINFTESYEKNPMGKKDLRNIISPKIKPDTKFKTYTQVFSEKSGFVRNLSVIDLIFNMGPESETFL